MSTKLKITSILFLLFILSCSKDDDSTNEMQSGNGTPELNLHLSNGQFDDFYEFENSTFQIQSTTSYIGSLDSKNNSNSSQNIVSFSLVITDLSQLKKGNTINYNTVELFIKINGIDYRGGSGKLVINKFNQVENSEIENTFTLDGTFEFNALNDNFSDNTDVSGNLKNITLVCNVCQL